MYIRLNCESYSPLLAGYPFRARPISSEWLIRWVASIMIWSPLPINDFMYPSLFSAMPPILFRMPVACFSLNAFSPNDSGKKLDASLNGIRSEEHTSELQSLRHLVCRLLLE